MSQINVTTIRSRTGGPPALDKGVVVTGIVTATTGNITGNLTVGGELSYEDVTNVDSVGIVTAGKGFRATTGGLIVTAGVATATDGIELGASGVGGTITAAGYGTLEGGLNVSGVSTFSADINASAGLDVDGHTELDDVNIAGVTTFVGLTTVTNADAFHAKQLNISGITTVSQGVNLDGYKVEEGSYDSDALNGEFDFELENGHIQTHTGSTAGTFFPDFRVSSSQSLSSVMDVGDVVSCTLFVAASNTAHYCTTGIKIDDSTSNLTIEWIGSAAPTAGKGAGFDVYAFTIQKTAATPAYLIIVNATDAG